jgi:serine protease Do
MTIILRALAFIAAAIAMTGGASAQSNTDIDAAARSVVRVVVVGADEGGEPNVGMGSGLVITPTRVVTNAHVVEAVAEGSGFVGIVPSEGRKRYTGKVIAYSANLDLAVIALQDGSITPAALFSGAVNDGATVAALGYPFAVDRAMATGMDEVIRPQSPVKSMGNISGRRSNERFDTVLHTAAIGRGNSGGPLVDTCGRVVGINSFLSISEGVDSTFAFALAVPELMGFLKKAGIEPRSVTTPCLSVEQVAAREAELARADEEVAAQEKKRSESDAAMAAREKQVIRDQIDSERDDRMALAGGLFGLGVVTALGGIALAMRRKAKERRSAPWLIALGTAFALGSVFVYLTRPSFSDVDDRYAAANPVKRIPASDFDPATEMGRYVCTLDSDRSRVTVSDPADVIIDLSATGCVNSKTQYGQNTGQWSRTFVSPTESTITIQTLNPKSKRYTIERYAMPADAMDKARGIRGRYQNSGCSAEPARRQSVADMEIAIRTAMPQSPNERLIYRCDNAQNADARGATNSDNLNHSTP